MLTAEEFNHNWTHRIRPTDCQTVVQDYEKEKFQLLYVIDRFFGTSEGFVFKEVNHLDGKGEPIKDMYERPYITRDISKAHKNIFGRMAELGLLLCGGAINSTFTNGTINDLDFYMTDASKKDEIVAFLSEFFPIEKMVTLNAITMQRKSPKSNKKYTVQLITRFSGAPQKIFNWFDFTITHGAYHFGEEIFYFGYRFFTDLAKRRLVYSGASKYPICAMYRTKKYQDRGYELPGATIMHIALSIVQLKITNYGELKEQLMGIDTIYLQKLIEAKQPDAPVNYGEFVHEAFQLIDHISGLSQAEEDDDGLA